MKTCFFYAILAPVENEYVDNKETVPLLAIPIQLEDGRAWEAAVLGTPSKISTIRITVPDADGPTINKEDFKRLIDIQTYVLDCIKMNYDPEAEYFHYEDNFMRFCNFLDSDVGPNLSMSIEIPENPDFRVNSEGLKALITAPSELRPIVHLLADGADRRMPMQFRFLSYYKVVEMHFKITTNKAFVSFASQFITEFHEIDSSIDNITKLCKMLSSLRNRCAHIKLGVDELGFSHLEADTDELINSMPLIRKMAVRCIQLKFPNSPLRFAATVQEREDNVRAMEVAGLKPIKVSGPN